MITNFDLIWVHTKKLAQALMSSSENLKSDELYSRYCSAFDQLMQIVENPDEIIDADKLNDVYLTVKSLEQAYINEQEALKGSVAAERMKSKVNSAYLAAVKLSPAENYNKQS